MKPLAGIILADQQILLDKGDLEIVARHKWHISANGYVAGWIKRNGQQKKVLLHRFLLNPSRAVLVDHINRNKLDNRRSNLRLANSSQNAANTKTYSSNTSGYRGVSWDKRKEKWAAYVKQNYVRHFLGYFATPRKAHLAYRAAARKLFGEFANT